MKTSVRNVLDSVEFRNLVARRWRMSMILSGLLFVLYYGYIILIATNPHLLSRRVGASTTLGIVMAAAVTSVRILRSLSASVASALETPNQPLKP